MAAEPIPLETELTSTVSPMRRPPRVKSMCHDGAERDLQRRGVVVGERLGDAHQLLGRRDDVLGEAAGPGDAEEARRLRAGTA